MAPKFLKQNWHQSLGILTVSRICERLETISEPGGQLFRTARLATLEASLLTSA